MNNDKLVNKTAAAGGVRQSRRLYLRLFLVCRLLLGLVFVYASYDKILHPQAFALAVFNYQIVPGLAVNLIALILPWLELLLGLCLLLGVWLPGATIAVNGLLIFFLGALVLSLVRGLDIHCGCFSTEIQEGAAGLGTVLRDLGFFAMSLYLLLFIFLYQPRSKRS